jgi:hypothetical protein
MAPLSHPPSILQIKLLGYIGSRSHAIGRMVLPKQYFSMDGNFSSRSSIQITLKNCLKYLKGTFSLVFIGRPRLKLLL